MPAGPHDPRDIPILTETMGQSPESTAAIDHPAVHAAIVTETLRLAETLLRQASRDIEATLFERVLDRLRAELPELVDRVLREHAAIAQAIADPAESSD